MTAIMHKSIVNLALPIFIGQIALMTNGVIDTVMSGRISAVDQAAVGIGMSVFFSVFVPLMGRIAGSAAGHCATLWRPE